MALFPCPLPLAPTPDSLTCQLISFFLGFWLYVAIELGLTDPRNMGTGISPANEKNVMRQ